MKLAQRDGVDGGLYIPLKDDQKFRRRVQGASFMQCSEMTHANGTCHRLGLDSRKEAVREHVLDLDLSKCR